VKSQLLMSSWTYLREEADLPSRRVASALRRLAQVLSRRRERLDQGDLHRMSDHLLKDIGLDRSALRHGVAPRGKRHH